MVQCVVLCLGSEAVTHSFPPTGARGPVDGTETSTPDQGWTGTSVNLGQMRLWAGVQMRLLITGTRSGQGSRACLHNSATITR